MPTRLSLLAAVLAVAGLAPAVPAQVVLAPGHPDLDLARVAPRTGVLAVRQGGQAAPMGTVRDDVSLDGGVLTVVTSTVVPMAGPALRDSTRMAWPSLAPVANAVETGGKAGAVTYYAGAVAGSWAGAPLAFDLERPVFAPAALPLVVRALPLDRPGYRAVVPLFSARERFQEATLTVAGPDTVADADGQARAVVAVDQAGGGGLTRGFAQRHYVDPETRDLLSVTYTSTPGTVVETVRR